MKHWHIQDAWIQSFGHPYRLHMVERIDEERIAVAQFQRLEIETVKVGTLAVADEGLPLTTDDAQAIMDELWRVGIRPRNGAGSLAHVEAQTRHLEDMRTIVFGASSDESET